MKAILKIVIRCILVIVLLNTQFIFREYCFYPYAGLLIGSLGTWLMYIPIWQYYKLKELQRVSK